MPETVFDCHLSPVSNGNQKLTISGLRLSIVLTLSIAAYPVWFCCMLHDVEVDILFGTDCA